jgi:hypothetical protein
MSNAMRLYIGGGSVLILVAILTLPTLLILFFGMLPTFVAFIIDRTSRKSQAICVGSMNFTGVFPSLMDLWYDTSNTYPEAVEIFSDVFVIGVMYSAAAFGYLMYMLIPPMVTTFLNVMAQRRVALLKDAQKQIIKEWGPEVAQIVADAEEEVASLMPTEGNPAAEPQKVDAPDDGIAMEGLR